MQKHPQSNSEEFQFQICSDLHVEFHDKLPDLLDPASRYVAFLGDIGVVSKESYGQYVLQQADRYEKLLLLAGNHEYYDDYMSNTLAKIEQICSSHSHLQFMNRTSRVSLLLG